MVEQPQLRAGTFYPITTGLVRSGVLSTPALAYIARPDRHQRSGSYQMLESYVCLTYTTAAGLRKIGTQYRILLRRKHRQARERESRGQRKRQPGARVE